MTLIGNIGWSSLLKMSLPTAIRRPEDEAHASEAVWSRRTLNSRPSQLCGRVSGQKRVQVTRKGTDVETGSQTDHWPGGEIQTRLKSNICPSQRYSVKSEARAQGSDEKSGETENTEVLGVLVKVHTTEGIC